MKFKKVVLYILVLVLVFAFSYLLSENKKMRDEILLKDRYLENLSSNYYAAVPQIKLNFENCGKQINSDCLVKDTAKNEIKLSEFVKKMGNGIMVCRYSAKYCQECVSHAIRVIQDSINSFDLSKILFIADNSDSRTFKLQMREYGLQNYNVVNCGDLGIPAEKVMFPYYVVIDSNFTVISTYFPNKSTHGTDFDFKNLKLMYENLLK